MLHAQANKVAQSHGELSRWDPLPLCLAQLACATTNGACGSHAEDRSHALWLAKA